MSLEKTEVNRKRKLQWDEKNLLKNEEERLLSVAEGRRLVTEPKTPYHYPDGSTKQQLQDHLNQKQAEEIVKIALKRRQEELEQNEKEQEEEEGESLKEQAFEEKRKQHYHKEFFRLSNDSESDEEEQCSQ